MTRCNRGGETSMMMCSPTVTTTESPAIGGSLPPQVVFADQRFVYEYSTGSAVLASPTSSVTTSTSPTTGATSLAGKGLLRHVSAAGYHEQPRSTAGVSTQPLGQLGCLSSPSAWPAGWHGSAWPALKSASSSEHCQNW